MQNIYTGGLVGVDPSHQPAQHSAGGRVASVYLAESNAVVRPTVESAASSRDRLGQFITRFQREEDVRFDSVELLVNGCTDAHAYLSMAGRRRSSCSNSYETVGED